MEVDETEETVRAGKNEQNLHQKRLVAGGENRRMALKRKSSSDEEHGLDQVRDRAESAASSAKHLSVHVTASFRILKMNLVAQVHDREEIERKRRVFEE